MPVASIARPINPPSAGLHGMCAMVSFVSVQMATSRPIRAAAHAASTPACPAPMTMTSCDFTMELLPYAEALEDDAEHLVFRTDAGDLVERAACLVQIRQHELLRDALP